MNAHRHANKNMNDTLKAYWNEHFRRLEPQAIDRSMIDLSNPLDQALKDFGDHAKHILDLGTGTGYCLFSAYLLGTRVKTGIGIDPLKKRDRIRRKDVNLIENCRALV